ncbi:putative methylated-DNA--protein-cysteine methyltransferase [Nitrososphaera viennensis EN76]|uniref:methylated-DNA--[protein]-cysteine S-methyltransferase n=2 Tax=Nitrososphaera viennensis TaxID=1034015 RepID=A0A060HM43_9ARCH|nr:putative methylated-DNA--protein-cysteine methyltransferase [Nitrososphaera viennensis EN76]
MTYYSVRMRTGRRLDAKDVYDLLRTVPEGQVTTYGDLAKALGFPGAARAIGRIMNANPDPIVVPCHRVVSSDGSIGGYGFGIKMKKEILAKEGLQFDGDAIVDFEKKRAVLKLKREK